VPSTTLTYSDPFGTGARPYLSLHLTGINGTSGNVVGLIDSGADMTQLPLGYASLMGYDNQTLEMTPVGTAGALTYVSKATVPCGGFVVGLADVTVDLLPVFSASSPFVLWGRTDFMARFGVHFDERNRRFTLYW